MDRGNKMKTTLIAISWVSTVLFALALIGNSESPLPELLVTMVFAIQPILTLIYLYRK